MTSAPAPSSLFQFWAYNLSRIGTLEKFKERFETSSGVDYYQESESFPGASFRRTKYVLALKSKANSFLLYFSGSRIASCQLRAYWSKVVAWE